MVKSLAFIGIGDAEDPHVWSGIPFHMLRALRACGIRVELISPLKRSFKYQYCAHRLWNRNFQIDRERVALRSYCNQIQAALDSVEVDLILSSSSIPVSILEYKRQPVVFWTDAVYDSMPSYYPGFQADTSNARHAHEQERNSLRNATFAVYSSEWSAGEAKNYYPEFAHKVRVIPFGANLELSPPSFGRLPPVPCKLLFVGIDWARKGGPIALETARLLNEMGIPTMLKIVGCHPPGKLPPYAECLGFLSKREERGREKLRTLLKEASFFILPTRAECGAVAFCEAAAYGLPVISTDTGGVATYVREGVSGRLLPADAPPQAYAAAVYSIVSDVSGLYSRLCLGSRKQYEERLNWNTSIQACLALAA